MVLVRFKRSYRMYNEGERAGFDAELAEKLVSAGVAMYVDGEVSSAPGDEHNTVDYDTDEHKTGLTKSKFERLNAEELITLAAELNIDLEGATLKKDVKPKLQAVLFPGTVKADEGED